MKRIKKTARQKQREDEGYEAFRQAVLKRDKKTCQFPGCKKKRYLQVHHILTYSKHKADRTNIKNGITLCCAHHKQVKGKELLYSELFFNIINNENNS